jgi:uncharacterized membrane protein
VKLTLSKIGLVIAFIPLVISLCVFPFLPESIPVHFAPSAPNAWADKWSGAGITAMFILPLMSIILCGILYRVTPALNRMSKEIKGEIYNKKLTERTLEIIVPLIATVLLIAHIGIIGLILNSI